MIFDWKLNNFLFAFIMNLNEFDSEPKNRSQMKESHES